MRRAHRGKTIEVIFKGQGDTQSVSTSEASQKFDVWTTIS
jgi:hypothetical protein